VECPLIEAMRLADFRELLRGLDHLEFQKLPNIFAIDSMVTGFRSGYPQKQVEASVTRNGI